MARSSPKKPPARLPRAKQRKEPRRDALGRFCAPPKKEPRRDALGRFCAPPKKKPARAKLAPPEPANRLPAPAKPSAADRLEQARLELRRSKRFKQTKQYRELLKSEPVVKVAVRDVQRTLTRQIEKLSEKAGGPSKPARERKRERDREYQKNRRRFRTDIGVMFKKGIRILGPEGIEEYLDEYDVSEHVFWVEFRKRYA